VPELQPGEKMVSGGGGSPYDAVSISNVTVEGMAVGSLKPFQAGDDWIQSMSISLKNRTNKTIVYVYVLLGFPEAGDGKTVPYAAQRIELGRPPAVDRARRDGLLAYVDPSQKPLSFAPGETLEIHVADYIPQIKAVVERKMYLSTITICRIHLMFCYFQDGMRWTAGNGFGLPDPDHPGRFKYFEGGYFPGNPTQNWPPWY
jgi:hypothetical protein